MIFTLSPGPIRCKCVMRPLPPRQRPLRLAAILLPWSQRFTPRPSRCPSGNDPVNMKVQEHNTLSAAAKCRWTSRARSAHTRESRPSIQRVPTARTNLFKINQLGEILIRILGGEGFSLLPTQDRPLRRKRLQLFQQTARLPAREQTVKTADTNLGSVLDASSN